MQKKSFTQTSNSLACVLCKCKGADEHCHGMFLFSTSESQYSSNSLELTDCVDFWPTTRLAHWKLHILFAFQASPPLYLRNYFFLETFPPFYVGNKFSWQLVPLPTLETQSPFFQPPHVQCTPWLKWGLEKLLPAGKKNHSLFKRRAQASRFKTQ